MWFNRKDYNKSYEEAKEANDKIQTEAIMVNRLQIGDVIKQEYHTFTITDIKEYQTNKWSTPRTVLSGYNNFNVDKEIYNQELSSLDYVIIVKD